MTQVLKPIELTVLTIILLIGVIALTTELIQYEEIAKIVVIPSLVLLIFVAAYQMFRSAYVKP